MRTDQYQGHDYYQMDDLLSEEHILVRDAARAWVKKEVSPIIEQAFEKGEFPRHLIGGLAECGAFGPYIPAEYGSGSTLTVDLVAGENSKDFDLEAGAAPGSRSEDDDDDD